MHVELQILHLQQCLSHISFAECSLQRKTENSSISKRHMTIKETTRAVGILQQCAGIRQVSHLSKKNGLQISVSCHTCRSLQQTKLNL